MHPPGYQNTWQLQRCRGSHQFFIGDALLADTFVIFQLQPLGITRNFNSKFDNGSQALGRHMFQVFSQGAQGLFVDPQVRQDNSWAALQYWQLLDCATEYMIIETSDSGSVMCW